MAAAVSTAASDKRLTTLAQSTVADPPCFLFKFSIVAVCEQLAELLYVGPLGGAPAQPAGHFVSVSTCPRHMCAIAGDGQAICSPDSGRPETVPPAFGMEQVAGGWQRGSYGGSKAAWVCGMREVDGTLRCSGSDAPSAPYLRNAPGRYVHVHASQ